MKYILASMLLVSLGCLSMQQQQNTSTSAMFVSKPYKSFAEFKGDTLQYLQYNFIERKNQYQGKKLEVLLKDLEFDIKYNFPGYMDPSRSNNVSLSFYDNDTHINRMANNEKLYILELGLKAPIMVAEIDKLRAEYGREWTKHHLKLYSKEVIRDVYVVVLPDTKLQKQ